MINEACNKRERKWASRASRLILVFVAILILVSCNPEIPGFPPPIFILPDRALEQPASVISEANVDDLNVLGFCGMGSLSDLVFSASGKMAAASTSTGLYVQNLEHLEERTFVKTGQAMGEVALSPDGTTLASGLALGPNIYLWRVSDFKLLKMLEPIHAPVSKLSSLAFSTDGELLASGQTSGMIQLWRLQNGTSERSIDLGSDWSVGSLVFSPDVKFLAGVGYRSSQTEIYLLSTVGDTLLSRFKIETDEELNQVAFSPDSSQLMTASWSRGRNKFLIKHWNVLDGSLLETLEYDGRDVVGQIALAPALSAVALMQPKLEGDGSELEILYLNDGELRPGPDEWIETIPYATPMDGMTFSSDGQLLAVSTNRRFYIWEVAAHRLLLMQPRFTAINADLTFSPDSRLVATTSEYNRQIWQISDCDVASAVGPGETKFLPDGRELVSIWNYYGIHEIEFFEPAGGGQLRPMKEKSIIGAPSDYLRALAVAPVGDYMAVATGKSVMLRQVSDGSLISVIDVRESVADTAFSPDGQLLAVGNGAFISLYKIPDGTLRQEIRAGDSDVEQIEFSPDGKMLASQAGTVRLWNVLDGSMLYELETRGPFAFSSDGSILATKLWKNETPDSSNKDAVQVGLWRTSDGHRLGTLNDNSKISSLAFSPDGTILAVSSEGGTILFWGVTP